MASDQPPFSTHSQALPDQHISQQQTLQHPAVNGPPAPIPLMLPEPTSTPQSSIKRRLQIIIPIV